MGDPYRSYRPGRGEPRYEYQPDPEYDYRPPYGGRGVEPPYDRPYDPYRDPNYDMPPAPRSGASRGDYHASRGGDYRAPPPIRPEAEYAQRSGRDYVPPPPAPRGSVGDPYATPAYYPPDDRGHRAPPPPRDTYERGYPPEPGYRDEGRYGRRRPREEEYEAPAPRDYDYSYDSEIPASRGRPPPPPIEYRGGATAAYEVEPVRRRPTRDPAAKLPPSMNKQPSPEIGDDEFTLPAEGIKKEVLQKYITRFLGNDAVSRGPMKEGDTFVYKYSAYRQFTTEQIRDLKQISNLSEPGGYPRAAMDARTREPPGPVITASSSRPSGRRNPDEDPMMTDPVIPRDEYVYTAGNPGTRAPAREIRSGRSQHDGPYGTSYHDPGRHGRQPIEASAMRPDDDDEMED